MNPKHSSDAPVPQRSTGQALQTHWSLIERLKDWGDEESWQDFFNTYRGLIYGVALKAGLSETEAQEVVQETLIAVAKKMPDFKCDPASGSFKGFLLQITGRRIADQYRKRSQVGQGSRLAPPDEAPALRP